MEARNVDDDEQLQQAWEKEPHVLDEYLCGPFDVFVIAKYQHHVAKRMFDGVVRFYIFNIFCTNYVNYG